MSNTSLSQLIQERIGELKAELVVIQKRIDTQPQFSDFNDNYRNMLRVRLYDLEHIQSALDVVIKEIERWESNCTSHYYTSEDEVIAERMDAKASVLFEVLKLLKNE